MNTNHWVMEGRVKELKPGGPVQLWEGMSNVRVGRVFADPHPTRTQVQWTRA
ncbi:hypothetical protein SAY87_006888 [Trapa incisa]|uniref:Uncharacterized protein n=1 Tax=Trapa incisa TaxID=236973 RepID=A0AAN7JZE4_9MYRT|nr:hypothetical protein SAY87_006888 [Trapa incisa]